MQLYDYQLDMLHRIEAAFGSHQSVMVQMPTGTGKTLVLASVVKSEERRVKKRSSLAEGKSNPCVWIVAHRRELVGQIRETLAKFAVHTDYSPLYPMNSVSSPFTLSSSLKVMSIQWLSRHYKELDEQPTLIVIDEAHHAVAKTYADVMNAYPNAKKLGVTATPCRLTRRGFTDLFEVLLTSKSISTFIKEGYLSDFDYVSLNPNSEDQKKINGLTKRATDGDFSVAEMQEVLDTRPTIGRLCRTVKEFAEGKKGIVYAINIEHAEHIAEYYREHGVEAVAISSKTPAWERKEIIERFKGSVLRRPETSTTDGTHNIQHLTTDRQISVLVNVDLFGEGFDCPDVEFIQLARPTLSLAKYLQMVGRGLRVAKNKACCTILDNVGLYRLFRLPNAERDWEAMFLGKQTGKGEAETAKSYPLKINNHSDNRQLSDRDVCDTDMVVIIRHDRHDFIEHHSRKKTDRECPWEDTMNGIRFPRRLWIERHGFLEFSTIDGMRLYPRVQTRLMDNGSFVLPDALSHGMDDGLRFRNFYIPPSDNPKLYVFKERADNTSLFKGEDNTYYIRRGLESTLTPTTLEEWKAERKKWKRMVDDFEKRAEERQRAGVFKHPLQAEICHGYKLENYAEPTDIRILRKGKTFTTSHYDTRFGKWRPTGSYTEIGKQAYGIRVVRNWDGKYLLRTQFFEKFSDKEDPKFDFAELLNEAYLHIIENGNEYFVDIESKMCFERIPELVKIGFVRFQKDGDMYFPFDCRLSTYKPLRRGEIIGGEDICFIDNYIILLKNNPSIFYIRRRYSDGKRFIVSKDKKEHTAETLYDLYYDGKNPVEIKARQ